MFCDTLSIIPLLLLLLWSLWSLSPQLKSGLWSLSIFHAPVLQVLSYFAFGLFPFQSLCLFCLWSSLAAWLLFAVDFSKSLFLIEDSLSLYANTAIYAFQRFSVLSMISLHHAVLLSLCSESSLQLSFQTLPDTLLSLLTTPLLSIRGRSLQVSFLRYALTLRHLNLLLSLWICQALYKPCLPRLRIIL